MNLYSCPSTRLVIAVCILKASTAWPSADTLSKASELFQKGEYDKAVELYREAAQDKSLFLLANTGLARVRVQQGEYEQAERIALETLDLVPGNPHALSLLGEIQYYRGDYAAARSNFEKALQQDSEHLDARLNLGKMQWEWGERAASRTTLQYFVSYYQRSPNLDASAIATIAEACIYLGRVRDANRLFNEATKLDETLWQAYIPWGNLMLSKYNIPDARGIFEDALKINPVAAEALLGLGECLKTRNLPQATASVEQALASNPNLVEAQDFLAMLQILSTNYEEGLEKLESQLDVNPNALSTLALRATCYYFLEQPDKYAAELAKITAINPNSSRAYYEIAEALSRRYLFKESVDFYNKVIEFDPENWAARAGLGTSLSRLGKEIAAKEELERAFAADPFNKYVANLLTLFDELPEYKSHQAKDLTIRIHEKDDAVLSKYAVKLANERFSELIEKYNITLEDPVILEIFPTHDDFAVRCFGLPGAEAFLGICFGNVIAMDSPRARKSGDFSWGETLAHELVHVTHLQATANRVPRWLAEGIAVYETTLAYPHWGMNLDLPFIRAFTNDQTLPIKDLDSGFSRPSAPGQVTLSYFQASKLVEFIIETYGLDQLVATFPKFKAGLGTAEVMADVFDKEVDALDEEFHEYIKRIYRLDSVDYDFDAKAFSGTDPEELAKALSEDGNNPLQYFRLGLVYKNAGDFENAIPNLEKAKSLFPRFVRNENPYKALAEIYAEQGLQQKAISELNALTALNGKAISSLNQLADMALAAGDWSSAVKALEKGLFITPFDQEIHQKLASVYMRLSRYDAAVEEYRVHLLTAPLDMAGAHCDLAEALLKAGQKEEAKRSALSALEIAPNYERAQEILLAVIE